MQLKRVVLPDPLGPMTAWIALSAISRSNWSTATRPPKRLVTLRAESTLVVIDVLSLVAGRGFARRGHARRGCFSLGPCGFVELPAPGCLRPQAFRPGQHHHDQQGAVHQQPVLGELAQEFG